jgi:oligopeptide transport system permease protein
VELVKGIVKSIITWAIVSLIIIFIIFIPRDAEYESTSAGVFIGAEYQYSFSKHINEIDEFFTNIVTNKSLGEYSLDYSVGEMLAMTLGRSAKTVIPALLLAYLFGILKGIWDYQISRSKWGFLGKGSSWFFLSVPDFFIVISLQILLMDLHYKGFLPHIDLFGSDDKDNIFMQIVYLMIYPLFYMAAITASAIEDEAGKDYIRTARSKGIKESLVIFRHILANTSLKLIRHFHTIALYLLSNLFIIERFADYQGAGYTFLETIYLGPVFALGSDLNLSMPALAVAYTLIFTGFILVVHIISLITVYRTTPYELGGKL